MVERMAPPPPPEPCDCRLGFCISGKGYFLSLGKGSHRGRFLYGNGSRGITGGAQPQSAPDRAGGTGRPAAGGTGPLAGGTGSNPPGVNGWQRSSRHAASPQPRNGPCVAMAWPAYSEHVGTNLHRLLLTACSAGEIHRA